MHAVNGAEQGGAGLRLPGNSRCRHCISHHPSHVLQFHISGLFPRKRGFISALFVAGFTGCGIVFYVLDRIFEDLGGHRCSCRALGDVTVVRQRLQTVAMDRSIYQQRCTRSWANVHHQIIVAEELPDDFLS